jgi:Ca2+-binding EF-hand superfamily protein
MMMITRKLAAAVTMIGIAGMAGFGAAQTASASTGADFKSWDTDHDGTIDVAEAKKAAEAKFDSLDSDHDGTIDRKESLGAIRRSSFAKADSDKDGTVDKNEYLNLTEARFNAADKDHDGTVSKSELHTPAGQSLLRLLK